MGRCDSVVSSVPFDRKVAGSNRIVIVNSEISIVPTKAKSREPSYSQALIQNKIDRQLVRSRESVRQADSQTAMVDGVWS